MILLKTLSFSNTTLSLAQNCRRSGRCTSPPFETVHGGGNEGDHGRRIAASSLTRTHLALCITEIRNKVLKSPSLFTHFSTESKQPLLTGGLPKGRRSFDCGSVSKILFSMISAAGCGATREIVEAPFRCVEIWHQRQVTRASGWKSHDGLSIIRLCSPEKSSVNTACH